MIDQATQIAINSPIENYAKQMSDEAALASGIIARGNAEDAFLYGKYGEYLNLQRATETVKETIGHWHFGGNVGNNPGEIGAGHPTAAYTWTPGDTAILTAKGILTSQVNVYFFTPQAMPTALPRRLVDGRTFQIADQKTWRALEWQSQFKWKGGVRNMAIQANLLTKKFRFFIYGDTWYDFVSLIDFPDFTRPVQIYTEYALDSTSQTHVAITIDGKRYPLNVTNKAVATTDQEKFTAAVQIDPLKDGLCSLNILQTDIRML